MRGHLSPTSSLLFLIVGSSCEFESSSRGRLLHSTLDVANESLVLSDTILSFVSSFATIGVDGLSRESSVNDDFVSSSRTVDFPFNVS